MSPLIQRLLRALHRTDVTECALATGRFPAARKADQWEALDQQAVTSDDILAVLVALGGDRHVERLSEQPLSWSFRSRGVGLCALSATRRGDDVRARFLVREREAPAEPKKSVRPPPAERPKSTRPAKKSLRPKAISVSPPPALEPVVRAEQPLEPVRAEQPLERVRAEQPLERVRAEQPLELDELSRKQSELMLDRDADRSLFEAPKRAAATSLSSALGELLSSARSASASDLHIVAERPPLFRVAGELTPRGDALDAARVESLLMPLVPARLRDELEKSGSCDFAFVDPALGRARINVSRQRTGLKGCFRLIPAEVPTLASLGLPEEVARATKHHQGLIVVTGPTGHGKTTTLAAIVDHINASSTHHVVTVEDPVEYVHPRKRAMMSQREVGTHTKSFARALKGALREDPDVIVVGELRDLETVAMAVAASETGHLVIGTMNTPSAAKTIDRLIDMFPPGDQAQVRRTLAGGLKLVIGQRLVPSIDRKRVHAAVELLTGTVALWNLIREEKTYQIPSLQQRGRSLGIIRLDDSLAGLVRASKVAENDAAAFAESPDTFATAVRGNVAPPQPEPQSSKLGFFGRKG